MISDGHHCTDDFEIEKIWQEMENLKQKHNEIDETF
jgi:hypothetical protein